MKTCKRCGETQPEENFRPYYGRPGRYTFCKTCEAIETRRKYLSRLSHEGRATEAQLVALQRIDELYQKRAAQGLSVPGSSRRNTDALIDELLNKLENGGT